MFFIAAVYVFFLMPNSFFSNKPLLNVLCFILPAKLHTNVLVTILLQRMDREGRDLLRREQRTPKKVPLTPKAGVDDKAGIFVLVRQRYPPPPRKNILSPSALHPYLLLLHPDRVNFPYFVVNLRFCFQLSLYISLSTIFLRIPAFSLLPYSCPHSNIFCDY